MLAFSSAAGITDSLTPCLFSLHLKGKKKNFLFQLNFEARWKTTAFLKEVRSFELKVSRLSQELSSGAALE